MDDYDLFKLSIQSALIGLIPDNLIAVTCGIRSKHLIIRAYFDGQISLELQELINALAKEVVADFPDNYTIEGHCLSVQDHPVHMLDFWAFLKAAPPRKPRGVAGKKAGAVVAG